MASELGFRAPLHYNYENEFNLQVNSLCVACQLQQKTTRLWMRVNDLHFPGRTVNRGIDDCEFFLRFADAKWVATIRSVVVYVQLLPAGSKYPQKLRELASNYPRVTMSAFQQGWLVHGEKKCSTDQFMDVTGELLALLQPFDVSLPGRI
ncbi:hypothetical protein EJ02DRAFT_454704 [Clathrospora elynae]|uniref:Uncharacterized protein n=1 Tax=Clathrospora elynae TaxID=706981 RepID=A0A6A5SY06_9PLEO|nr:hypothetical protein EJ02DRAFT_454704 [Clathrospora elynae]